MKGRENEMDGERKGKEKGENDLKTCLLLWLFSFAHKLDFRFSFLPYNVFSSQKAWKEIKRKESPQTSGLAFMLGLAVSGRDNNLGGKRQDERRQNGGKKKKRREE